MCPYANVQMDAHTHTHTHTYTHAHTTGCFGRFTGSGLAAAVNSLWSARARTRGHRPGEPDFIEAFDTPAL